MAEPDGITSALRLPRHARGYWSAGRALNNADPPPVVFIYAMECEGFIKIGIASDLKKRLAAMKGHNPFPVKLVSAQRIRADGAGIAERMAHEKLADCHHSGEWFRCTPHRAVCCIRSAIEFISARPMPYDLAIRELSDRVKRKWA